MKFFDLNKKIWQWIFLLLLAFVWGSSFILMKKGLVVYSHTVVAALRISISFLFLLPFALINLRKVERKYWKFLIISGFLGNGIPAFLFTKAQTEISSSLSGMLNSLTPIFALIIGVLLFKAKPLKMQVVGVFIGLLGAISLVTSSGINFSNSDTTYAFYIVIATICYGFSVNIIKNKLKEVSSIVITSMAFFSIGPFALIYLLSTDFTEVTLSHSGSTWAIIYVALLAIFGTAISVILFNMLIKKTSTIFATSVTYLIPGFAIFWGILDGELLNALQIIGIITSLFGIYFINKNK